MVRLPVYGSTSATFIFHYIAESKINIRMNFWMFHLPKLNQDEVYHLNKPLRINKIEAVNKTLPTKRKLWPVG